MAEQGLIHERYLENKRTPLYERHLAAGARMVDFAGWDMPLHYGSQIAEHRQVREHAGVFDVSHMTVLDVDGPEAEACLKYLLSNDVGRLDAPGKAQYTLMLNEEGGVVDDLIVYRRASGWRLVLNCATRDKDLRWIARQARNFEVALLARPELAILAVHGPAAIETVCGLLPADQAERVRALGAFKATELGGWLLARTGYTGEKGLELIVPEADAPALWDSLLADGLAPVGLGARDTLRLEAGMNLYGQDMDEQVSPLAANLDNALAWEPQERRFIGRDAISGHLRLREAGSLPELRGLVMEERGVLRAGQTVLTDKGEGSITSGGFSPILNRSIALARLPNGALSCEVDLRGSRVPLRIVKPNFVRFGKSIID